MFDCFMTELLQVYFDGGCRPTNPGNKYGSYEIVLNGKSVVKVSRIEFGWGTNNEAEFNALDAALFFCVDNLKSYGFPFDRYNVEVFTDSTVVYNRILKHNRIFKRNYGAYFGKEEFRNRMAVLALKCLIQLNLFKSWTIQWKRREFNVKRFGH